MRLLPLLAVVPLLAGPAAARSPVVHVTGWTRATVPGQTGSAAYLSIHNAELTPQRLIGVSTPAAASASIHSTSMAGGVMRMRAAGPLTIAAGKFVAMQPGGLHIMLTGLKAPLRAGQRLPLTLRFAAGGTIRTSVPIRLEALGGAHSH